MTVATSSNGAERPAEILERRRSSAFPVGEVSSPRTTTMETHSGESQPEAQHDKLNGSTFVFDESASKYRDEFEEVICRFGGTINEDLSDDADFFVIGMDVDVESKQQEAWNCNAMEINEEALFDVLADTCGVRWLPSDYEPIRKLDGLTFAFDDSIHPLVRKFKEVLIYHGATVEESVSSDTDYLIADVNPDKWINDDAETHDVTIIDEEGMFDVMDEHDAHEDAILAYKKLNQPP